MGPVRRVLFLSGLQIHPTLSGGNLRSFALANALAHHGLEVFVYSLAGRKKDYFDSRSSSIQVWPEGILEYVERGPCSFFAQYGSYLIGLPPLWLTAYLRLGAVSPGELLIPVLLRDRLAWCDAVVADFPFVHEIFGARSARGKLRILSTHNVEHHLVEPGGAWPRRLMRRAVRSLELRAANRCDILVSCSAEDARFFQDHASAPRAVVVPNAIDRHRFSGVHAHRTATRRELGIADDEMVLLFTASKWGPNREAFEYLLEFATEEARFLIDRRLHILVVGSVVAEPIRRPGFTATGRVEAVEPYFGAADVALNPVLSGAGTNVKMCEFIAVRLPVLSTPFGARGFHIEDGETGFLFEPQGLGPLLETVRRLFDEEPERLRKMAARAYADNETRIDMDQCVRPLLEAMSAATAATPREPRGLASGGGEPLLFAGSTSETAEETQWLG